MKKLLLIFGILLLTSCAHHHEKPEHHHHAYDKQCAQSVAEGKFDVKGKGEYKINHGGKTYYFSSLEKKEEFKSHIKENIETADKNWLDRGIINR